MRQIVKFKIISSHLTVVSTSYYLNGCCYLWKLFILIRLFLHILCFINYIYIYRIEISFLRRILFHKLWNAWKIVVRSAGGGILSTATSIIGIYTCMFIHKSIITSCSRPPGYVDLQHQSSLQPVGYPWGEKCAHVIVIVINIVVLVCGCGMLCYVEA